LAQQTKNHTKSSDFWQNVQFGGGVGLGLDQITLILWLQVLFIISMNIALGLGAQYTYLKAKITMLPNFYGGSIIGLFNPIPVIQLSAELEELRININLDGTSSNSQDYWNTGLFLGAGYRSGNATIGARYNVERY
jgi:hypothetical protein